MFAGFIGYLTSIWASPSPCPCFRGLPGGAVISRWIPWIVKMLLTCKWSSQSKCANQKSIEIDRFCQESESCMQRLMDPVASRHRPGLPNELTVEKLDAAAAAALAPIWTRYCHLLWNATQVKRLGDRQDFSQNYIKIWEWEFPTLMAAANLRRRREGRWSWPGSSTLLSSSFFSFYVSWSFFTSWLSTCQEGKTRPRKLPWWALIAGYKVISFQWLKE